MGRASKNDPIGQQAAEGLELLGLIASGGHDMSDDDVTRMALEAVTDARITIRALEQTSISIEDRASVTKTEKARCSQPLPSLTLAS
mgnify:CR=1 FL=1